MNANQLKTLDGWTGEVYSPNDPPWPSQLKAGLGLVMMMMTMMILLVMLMMLSWPGADDDHDNQDKIMNIIMRIILRIIY